MRTVPRKRGSSTSFNIEGSGLWLLFSQTATDLSPKGYGRLRSITIRLCITDCTGKVYFTDIMVQGGSIATGWVGHPSEIQWTLDG